MNALFCGFAFRKIDNDIRSPLFFLFLYTFLSSHLLYVPDEQV